MEKPANVDRDGGLISPSAPAWAGVPLREVLRAPCLAGTRVLAGGAGLERAVTRVNVMEVPDITPWVRPGELLLTTGYPLRAEPERLTALVDALVSAGVAAVGVMVGRYLDEVPAATLARAEATGLPVLSLPAAVSFDDVITEVLGDLVDHQARALTRAEAVHRRLVDLVLDGGGLPEVAAGLADALDAAVVVTTPDGRQVAAAGSASDLAAAAAHPWTDTTGRLRTEHVDSALGLHAHAGGPGGHAVVTVAAGQLDHGRIAAFTAGRRLGADDLNALERAALVVALVVTKELAVAAVEGRYRADFLRDLLLGRAGAADGAAAHAADLGWDLDRRLVVLVLQPHADDPGHAVGEVGVTRSAAVGRALRPLVERQAAALTAAVRRRDPRAAVAAYSTEAVALLGIPPDGDTDRLVRELVAAVRGEGGGGRRPFGVGVSRAVDGVADLATGYEQARTAVRVGRRVQGAGAVAHFDALGVYRLLSLVPDPGELRAFAVEVLGPLAAGGDEATDLRGTLTALLETNLNVAETARRLHFHYNTLRYRIGKLERLLGPFTCDPALRLDVAVALKVVDMAGLESDHSGSPPPRRHDDIRHTGDTVMGEHRRCRGPGAHLAFTPPDL